MNSYPEVAINKYVWEQFRLDSLKSASVSYLGGFDYAAYAGVVPFFPLEDGLAGSSKWGDKPYVRFDSFLRPRSSMRSFYPIKSAQMIYSIKGGVDEVFQWRDFISNVLDREDQAAKDINSYAGQNLDNYYTWFHNVSTMQIQSMNQSSPQASQRKTYSADLIIRYEYHITNVYNA